MNSLSRWQVGTHSSMKGEYKLAFSDFGCKKPTLAELGKHFEGSGKRLGNRLRMPPRSAMTSVVRVHE